MRISLDRKLTLQAATQAPDGAGGFATVWTDLGQHWAEIRPGTGRDAAGEDVILTSVPYRITVRGAPVGAASRPKAGQRFSDGARRYSVLAVTERDRAGLFLTCFAQEETPT